MGGSNVVKNYNVVPIKNKAADDLKAFIFAEVRDHVSRLHDCAANGADEVTTDYHHEKIMDMLEKLEGK